MRGLLRPALSVHFGALALLTSAPGWGISASGTILALSFPHVGLSSDEWIGYYECSLQGARVVAIREIPYVWGTKIKNKKGGRADIFSAHVLGTGPMGKDSIDELQELFVLERPRALK
jgi:hypothetical protein